MNEQPFKPTMADVEDWFESLNFHIFNNKLDFFDNIRIANTTRAKSWGWVDFDIDDMPDAIVDLRLHNVYPNVDHFVSVLGHEMVHLYQIRNCDPAHHDKLFFSFKKKFEELGFMLAISMDNNPINQINSKKD